MITTEISRRRAMSAVASLFLLPTLTACPLSPAAGDAQIIADALNATWRLISTQLPNQTISLPAQSAVSNALAAIDAAAWELNTQPVTSATTVEDFVKGVNEVITAIVANAAIPLSLAGPTGDPVSDVLAAVAALTPNVESSFKLSIPLASTQRRPAAAAVQQAPPPPMASDTAQEILTRVAATRK